MPRRSGIHGSLLTCREDGFRIGSSSRAFETLRCVVRRAAGFTLIELMLVVTLIAVLAMTVTPVFRGSLAGIRGDNAARDLFADMKAAQERAIVEAAEYRMYFELRERRYWTARAVFTEDGALVFEPLPGADGEDVYLPRGLTFRDVVARRAKENQTFFLSFYPSGAGDQGRVTLAASDDLGDVYTVESTGTRVEFYVPEVR